MELFAFGEKSITLIYPFIMGISFFFVFAFMVALTGHFESKKYQHHPFFYAWMKHLIESFAVIVFLIQKKMNKSIYQEKGDDKKYSGNIKLAMTSKYTIEFFPGNDKKHLFWCLVGISLFSCMNSLFFFILRGIGNTDYCTFLGNCILIYFVCFLSKRILHYKFHRHHLLGLGINSVGIIINTLVTILSLYKGFGSWIINIIVLLVSVLNFIMISLQECLEKYMIDYKYLSPYAIISFEGFTGVIINGLVMIFAMIIPCKSNSKNSICINESFESLSSSNNNNIFSFPYYLYFIGLMLSVFCYDVSRVMTNQHFSPAHRYIGDALGFMLMWLCFFIYEKFDESEHIPIVSMVFSMIGFAIMFFGSFIYLEVILVKVFDFDRNTKKQINIREDKEVTEMNKNLISETKNDSPEELNERDSIL